MGEKQWLLVIILIVIIRFVILPRLRKMMYPSVPGGIPTSDRVKPPSASEFHFFLNKKNTFYQSLSPGGKKKFVSKSLSFARTKVFVGMEGMEVTEEMVIAISATAAQLTYGLNRSDLPFYRQVRVYPKTFYSGLHKSDLKGGASTKGVLFFSWEDFQAGFADEADRYNLGLHEMAHALRLELLHGSKFDQRFANYSDHWQEVAMEEFMRLRKGQGTFLRDYAGTNLEEFFAVCIEHFFEVPEAFREHLPDIYNHLCVLLNLDPLNRQNDYELPPGFIQKINADSSRIPVPTRIRRNYRYDTWHWSFNFIVAGLFLGVPVILIYLAKVAVEPVQLVFYFVVVLLFISIFRQFFSVRGIYMVHHLVFFGLSGVAVPLLSLGMLANHHIHGEIRTETYQVSGYKVNRQGNRPVSVSYLLKDDPFGSMKRFRNIPLNNLEIDPAEVEFIMYETSTGVLQLKNINSRYLIHHEDTVQVPETVY
jgi:MtfA peptidase